MYLPYSFWTFLFCFLKCALRIHGRFSFLEEAENALISGLNARKGEYLKNNKIIFIEKLLFVLLGSKYASTNITELHEILEWENTC